VYAGLIPEETSLDGWRKLTIPALVQMVSEPSLSRIKKRDLSW
jgi:hypothetical protein